MEPTANAFGNEDFPTDDVVTATALRFTPWPPWQAGLPGNTTRRREASQTCAAPEHPRQACGDARAGETHRGRDEGRESTYEDAWQ